MPTKFTFILLAFSSIFIVKAQAPPPQPSAPPGINSFGEVLYPHPNSVLSSASAGRFFPGFLMAGYQPVRSQGANFYIDRTAQGGDIVNNPNGFQREYSISTSTNCAAPFTQAVNCAGISVIETNIPASNAAPACRYAVAGALDEGCFISLLSSNGTPVNTFFINFALVQGAPVSSTTKPLILEASNPAPGNNEFYVCGTYNFWLSISNTPLTALYVHRINQAGTIIWSKQYLIISGGYIEIKDMIESPYLPNLVLVGKTLSEGVMIDLDRATGGTIFRNTVLYNVKARPTSFSCITVADGQNNNGGAGFIIGGQNQAIAGSPHALVMKVSPLGNNIIWRTTLTPSSDRAPLNINDVVERKKLVMSNSSATNSNPNSSATVFEYYAVTSSPIAGAIVLKLNQQGIPFPNGYNEFPFNTGTVGNGSTGDFISFAHNANFDNGLHIYGNNMASGSNSHLLVQSYFNGFAGCNTPQYIAAYEQPEINTTTNGLWDLNLPLSHCNGFVLTSTLVSSYNALCGPNVMIPLPADNARVVTNITTVSTASNHDFKVSPNPTANKTIITFPAVNDSENTIELYNSMGQLITKLHCTQQQSAVELDFEYLGLEAGVYFVKSGNGNAAQQKVIYTKS